MLNDLQTPSKHNLEHSKQICVSLTESSPDSDNTQTTPMSRGDAFRWHLLVLVNYYFTIGCYYLWVYIYNHCFRNFALDKQWFTIHTVCFDLLNSPEIWDMKKMPVSESVSHLCKSKLVFVLIYLRGGKLLLHDGRR